ncbi:olfactory receptor 51E2-like [Spheniscus humboldti]
MAQDRKAERRILPNTGIAQLHSLKHRDGGSYFSPTDHCYNPSFALKWDQARASQGLSHSFCLHQDVMNLACANTTPSVVYSLTAILLVMRLDTILICLSYVLILRAVLWLASWKKRLKVFSTCVALICVVLVFYVPLTELPKLHRFGKGLAPLVHITMGNIYILVPAVLNPIIYKVRAKQIQRILISINISDDRTAH